MRKETALFFAVAVAAGVSSASADNVLRPPNVLMAVMGTYELTLKLPGPTAGAPAVPSEQVCAQIEVQIGKTESKVCQVGPTSQTVSVFKAVETRTTPGVYDAAARTCKARGTIRAGAYEVRARYLTTAGQTPPTWNPPMTSQIESISGEGRITIEGRKTTALQVNLGRAQVIGRPQLLNGC